MSNTIFKLEETTTFSTFSSAFVPSRRKETPCSSFICLRFSCRGGILRFWQYFFYLFITFPVHKLFLHMHLQYLHFPLLLMYFLLLILMYLLLLMLIYLLLMILIVVVNACCYCCWCFVEDDACCCCCCCLSIFCWCLLICI